MAGVLYSAEWDCGKCALRLRGFFKEKDVVGSLCRPPVDCPGCGETSEDLVAKPYRPDKQIAENKWIWERMA